MSKKSTGAPLWVVLAVLALSVAMVVSPWVTKKQVAPSESQTMEGVVLRVVGERPVREDEAQFIGSATIQQLSVGIVEGGKKRVARVTNEFSPVGKGDRVYLETMGGSDPEAEFAVVGISKSKGLLLLAVFFVALVFLVSGKKGLQALVGLAFSLAVIFAFVLPFILQGYNAVAVSLVGSIAILLVSFYVSYGFSRKAISAVIGISVALLAVGMLAQFTVHALGFSGFSTDESAFLFQEVGTRIDLVALLIGGIMIAAIGVLDDVAITQASAVFALKSANPSLGGWALYRKAMVVGADHISAVVNTLILAYVGASLPLLLLLSTNGGVQLGYGLSIEVVAEEVVRTLVSSTGIVLGVPVTTAVAILLAGRGHEDSGKDAHGHVHGA